MPVPPPLADPTRIEARLLLLADVLDRTVAEVRRVTAEIRAASPPPSDDDESGSSDEA